MYLFNPENDLALANFSLNYTPPASAIRMAEELAVLPIWYAGADAASAGKDGLVGGMSTAIDTKAVAWDTVMAAGSADTSESSDTKVIAAGELNRSFLETVKKVLPVQASLVSFSDIAENCSLGMESCIKEKTYIIRCV